LLQLILLKKQLKQSPDNRQVPFYEKSPSETGFCSIFDVFINA